MKKTIVLTLALVLSLGTQAQIGGLVRDAVKKGVDQKVEEKLNIRQAIKKVDPLEKEQVEQKSEEKGKIPTPEEVMAMVPQIPQPQQLADYACEQNRDNPRTLKMLANPTTVFMTQMVAAMASGYVVMMGGAQAGNIYNFDEHLLKELGITQEQYDAMSEEEQRELANKYAAELQDRYLRTAEFLANDKEYAKLMDRYNEIESEIQKKYDDADSLCRGIWQKISASKKSPTEDDMCAYFKGAVPMQYKVVLDAMKIRKDRQLVVAKQMDLYVQKLAASHPDEVYPGFYNQGGICATAYVGDAARLTTLSDPR